MVADFSKYAGREQAYVKHYFLRSYFEPLVFKTASSYDHITYVDGFSGPWQSAGESFDDTSFGIALSTLRKAKAAWRDNHGRDVRMSAHLVEKSKAAYRNLASISSRFPDIEIHTYNRDFVEVAPEILRALPKNAFTFFFIDPKGWRIDMRQLSPLLCRDHSEVVFNFMFEFINRAASISDQAIVDGLGALIPVGEWREQLNAATPENRQTILGDAFAETLRALGRYDFVAQVPVLRPLRDRMLYALFYGTRSAKGIEVFRAAHVKTEREQARVRDEMKTAQWEARTGQISLFKGDPEIGVIEINAFLAKEQIAATKMLLDLAPPSPRAAKYGAVWPLVLAKHAVTHPELNQIAAKLRKEGRLLFPGWELGKRVPADDYLMTRA